MLDQYCSSAPEITERLAVPEQTVAELCDLGAVVEKKREKVKEILDNWQASWEERGKEVKMSTEHTM